MNGIERIIEADLKILGKTDEPVLTFMENKTVDIEYNSEAYVLEIECFAYKPFKDGVVMKVKIDTDSDDPFYRLSSGTRIEISDSGDPDFGYCPGDYLIRIINKNNREDVRECFFRVEHNPAISNESFETLRNNLEDLIRGITFSKNRRYGKLEETRAPATIEEFLDSQLDNVLSAYRKLSGDLNPSLVNTYVKEKIKKRQNAKSIRMNLMHPSDDSYINVKKQVEISNIKNRALYHYVLMTRMLLNDIFKGRTMPDSAKKIYDVYSRLYNYLAGEGVTPSSYIPLSFFEDAEYVYFKDFYEKLKYTDLEITKKKSRKRSTIFFELFVLYLADKALIQGGYRQIGATGTDPFDFKSGSEVIYENDTNRAVVLYDYKCSSYLSWYHQAPFVSINSRHDKPDFICYILDKETSQLKNCVVFDMKYRPERHLINNETRNELVKHMNDYAQLAYLDPDENVIRGVVKKLFVIYPDNENKVDEDYAFNTDLLGINIEKLTEGESFKALVDSLKD